MAEDAEFFWQMLHSTKMYTDCRLYSAARVTDALTDSIPDGGYGLASIVLQATA